MFLFSDRVDCALVVHVAKDIFDILFFATKRSLKKLLCLLSGKPHCRGTLQNSISYLKFLKFLSLVANISLFSIHSQLRYQSLPLCPCSPMFPQRCTVCMKKGEIREKVEFSSLFCHSEYHVLCFAALAPAFKDAILLSLSTCASCLLLVSFPRLSTLND